MRAFVIVGNGVETLDGVFDFRKLNNFTIYSNIETAITNLIDDKDTLMEFEFVKDIEILNAVFDTIYGNQQSRYTVKWIAAYTKKFLDSNIE